MKNYSIIIVTLLLCSSAFSQVGIGTSDPKAQLDIVSNSPEDPGIFDGILIPRVSKFPTSLPSRDQHGMLIFLANDIGEKKSGFYYWDYLEQKWQIMGGNSGGNFYKPGTTINPQNIDDPVYRTGGIGLGTMDLKAKLQIAINSPADGSIKRGLEVDNNNPTVDNLTTYGIISDNRSATNGNKYGIKNNVGGAGTGIHYGIFNETYQNSGTNEIYGFYNRVGRTFGGFSNHYGIFSEIGTVDGQGYVYGIYSKALGNNPSRVFAGYFAGRLGIGVTPQEEYIFPGSRGSSGQILVVDNTGNMNWSFPNTKNYSTTGSATGDYVIPSEVYTLRINNQVSGITLPKASENTGRILILIGWPGISAKTLNFSTGDDLLDISSNTSVTEIGQKQVYKIQSAGNRWLLLRK